MENVNDSESINMQEIVASKESTSNLNNIDDTVALVAVETQRSGISHACRNILLFVFSLAEFLDTFNNASLFVAIPTMAGLLNMTGGQSFWLISAYQMCMASCLLISGRISDVYKPKAIFVIGSSGIVILSIVAGFVQEKIGLIILRAFLGICAALTIPSALALIIYLFPEPKAQVAAIGVFSGCGAIGSSMSLAYSNNLLPLNVFTWTHYWCYINTICFLEMVFLFRWYTDFPNCGRGFPTSPTWHNHWKLSKASTGIEKLLTLDLLGIFLLTAGLLLFTFALIQAMTEGWVEAGVLVPLFLGIGLVVIFFWWESKAPTGSMAIPHIWSYTNFTFLTITALLPYGFGNVISALLSPYWQDIFRWSIISFAVHSLPLGVTTIAIGILAGPMSRFIIERWSVVVGVLIMAVGAVLLIFASTPDRYWSIEFHTFIWGCIGFLMVYMHINVAIFQCTPPSMAGTVGAIFNACLQLGSALGVAIVTSIQQNVQAKNMGTDYKSRYTGVAAAFKFYAALLGFMAIVVFLLYRNLETVKIKESKPDENQIVAEEKKIEDSTNTFAPVPEP